MCAGIAIHTHVPRAGGRQGGDGSLVPSHGQGRGRDEEGVQGREEEEAAGQEEGEGMMWHHRVCIDGGWLEQGGGGGEASKGPPDCLALPVDVCKEMTLKTEV